MDPLVREDLFAADRNLTIASDLVHHRPDVLDVPAHEWVVVICFYSTVRCINAFLVHDSGERPTSHVDRLRRMRGQLHLNSILVDFTKLRNWSEQARYTHSYDTFSGYQSQAALDAARTIRGHVESLISGEP